MHLSAPFIRRPVATSLLSLALLLGGAVGYTLLPVASLPEVEFPTISVYGGLPGASPETAASSIATPLERQFGRIAGVTEMTSSSSLGGSSVTMQFDLSRNIDAAARDVQAAINAARSQLPANLPSNPSYRKVNPSDAPIMIIALTSDTLTKGQMYDAADSILAQKISQISGVGQVFVGGSAQPAVRAELNPLQLSSYGIGLEGVRAALSSVNVNMAKGYLKAGGRMSTIADNDQLMHASEYAPLIVGYNPTTGAAVRLADLGEVVDSVSDIHTAGLANGKPAVLIIVFKVPGANIISTIDRVYAAIPSLKASISPLIDFHVVLDRTTTIRAAVLDVEISLLISIVLVVLVVFLFLRNVWATIIPSVAVPLSLVGTFGIIYLMGYSLDNLSLMALTISTGFVVDDAIVVIENITRYLEMGLSPYEAAMKGSREIGFTVLSMSTSLIAVFIPILLMGGIVGRLFREFAVTLSVAIAVSLLISLTTTPMMCARFLKAHNQQKHGRIYNASERFFDGMLSIYEHGLRWVLAHKVPVLLITIGTFFLNIYLFILVPKGFFPQQDTGRLSGAARASQDISFDAMQAKQAELADIVQEDPGVQSVMAFAGGSGGGATGNVGRMFITLKPLSERNNVSADQIINRLRPKLAHIPGVTLFLQSSQEIRVGGRSSDAEYQYTLEDENIQELNEWAPKLLEKMRTMPELRDASTDQQDQGLAANLVVDRDTAARLGISPQLIDNVLYDAFGQRQVSTMYTSLNQYHVVMEVAPQYQKDPDSLRDIYVKSSGGTNVPLPAVTKYQSARTSLAVNHQGQFPAVTLTFNLAPGISLGQAVTALQNAEADMGMPSTVHPSFQGTAQAFQSSLASEPFLILTALATVYIVLGMLYESYIHPITILSTLPSAGVGAILALLITHTDLSVIAVIGIILLIGIVKKNAILMIDFALSQERNAGKSSEEAIYEACLLRFRPIMMTTMAALLGGLPLALMTGTGSELRRPLGITIVGGLIVSQMLTLFTTPVVYLFFDKLQLKVQRFGKRLEKGETTPSRQAPAHGD
ncbi:MAG TPA: multidrug efflux RND transporter permease subunit [Alloacidobacterium sp.]|jgi:multidrug efflux pump|nr:multidrug efflux RND transporter permease subunit [Alloacidobacterium sp.]